MTYLVTSGQSMEPPIRSGALVLLRSSANYQVGDVVAFRNGNGSLILHRIVDREGDRFVMRGDNNAANDDFRPAHADIVGELWVQVPGLGRVVEGSLWLLVLGAALVLGSVFVAIRRLRTLPSGGRRRSGPGSESRRWPPGYHPAVVPVGLLVISGIVLGLVSFTRPLRTEHVETLTYLQRGELLYSATADPAVYPGGFAATGDPVYRRHADSVDLTFNYNLVAGGPVANVSGTGHLMLVLRSPDGWTSTIQATEPASFQGTDLAMTANLDFAQVDERIENLEGSAGLPPDYYESYELALVASVRMNGTAGVTEITDEFVAAFDFVVDDFVFRIDPDRQSVDENTLTTQVPGARDIAEDVNNRIDLVVLDMDVGIARSVSIGLVIAGASAAAILLLGTLRWQLKRQTATVAGSVEAIHQTESQVPARRRGAGQTPRLTTITPRTGAMEGERSSTPTAEDLALSLARIERQLVEHDSNVAARFDDVLEEIDHLHPTVNSSIGADPTADVAQRRPSRKPAALRPIRLKTRAERSEASMPDNEGSPGNALSGG